MIDLNGPTLTGEELMQSYVLALEEHRRAESLMADAERRLDRFCNDGISDKDAYARAGVDLADRRALRASCAVQDLRRRLQLAPGLMAAIRAVAELT